MRTRRDGFTLIELLTVIGIIGLLIGLVTPSYVRIRQAAHRTRCAASLRGVATALQSYLKVNNEVMPVAAALPSAGLNDLPRIADVLQRDIGDPDLLRCPADDEGYFEREGSSYEYNTMLGGRPVDTSFLTERLGQDNTPVMYDYRPFHGRAGTFGSTNYLFASGRVGDLLRE